MLRERVLTALIGIPLTVLLVYLGGILLALVIWFLAILSLKEYRMMIISSTRHQHLGMFLLISCLVFMAQTCSLSGFGAMVLLLTPLLFCYHLFFTESFTAKDYMQDLLGVVYLGLGFSSLLLIRKSWWLDETILGMHSGLFFILFLFLGTWLSDIGAYFCGKKWGKHPLIPRISPNKTVEGFFGGMILTVFGLLFVFATTSLSIGTILFLALLIAISSPLGDLFESALKRTGNIKDSGRILPGHGGILDRFDSVLFSGPVLLWGLLILTRGL